MRIKSVAGVSAAIVFAALVSAKSVQQSIASAQQPPVIGSAEASSPPSPSPFPDVCTPGVQETGNCCLWEIVRNVNGKREAKYGSPYTCDMGRTRRGDMAIKMSLTFPHSPCDQQDIPANNSTLEAKGAVIRRDDGYAYFSGEFAITDTGGKVLFKGRIQTTDRLGTHHTAPACERCNPISHFEGWLVGRGTDACPKSPQGVHSRARNRALAATVFDGILGTITGTLVKCP